MARGVLYLDACTHISKVRRMSARIKAQQFELDVPMVICIKGLLYNVVSQDPRASQEDHQWPIPCVGWACGNISGCSCHLELDGCFNKYNYTIISFRRVL